MDDCKSSLERIIVPMKERITSSSLFWDRGRYPLQRMDGCNQSVSINRQPLKKSNAYGSSSKKIAAPSK